MVALGGGHGLYSSLSAIRLLTDQVTAVVTVADDGGSSGRLRRELGILPPGDLRMALSALCDDTEWGRTWRDVLQHRFTGEGELAGHAVGNLLIASLWQRLGNPVAGLDWVGRLLEARGRVLPMSVDPVQIEADVADADGTVQLVVGQVEVATAVGTIRAVRLEPARPTPCAEALAAVLEADWVVLGPGSWFTSVIPHLLVPPLREALETTRAKRLLILNLGTDQKGEAADLTSAGLVRALGHHAPKLQFNAVIADPGAVEDLDDLATVVEGVHGQLVVRQVSTGRGSSRHDPLRLAAAMRDVIVGSLGDV